MGGDGDAIGPFSFGLKFEDPLGEILAGFPTGGGSGKSGSVFGRVFHAESLEESSDDVGLEDTGNEVGIEALGFVGVPYDENVLLVCNFDIGPRVAGGHQKRQGDQDGEQFQHRGSLQLGEALANGFSRRWVLDL